jgi:hypothetical protein
MTISVTRLYVGEASRLTLFGRRQAGTAYLFLGVINREKFLSSKGANYDRAWDNGGPDLR